MMGGVSSSRNASNANANAIKKMPMPATPLPVAGKKKVASNAPLPATAPVAPAAKSSGVSARSTAGAAAVAAVAAVAARPAAPALQSQVQTQIQMQEPFPSITIDEPLAVSAVSSQTRSCIEQLHIERASLQHNFGNLTKQTLTQQKKLVEAAFGQQLQQLDDHYAAEEQKVQARWQQELNLLASQKEMRKKEVKDATMAELSKLDLEGQRLLDFAAARSVPLTTYSTSYSQPTSMLHAAPVYLPVKTVAVGASSNNPDEFERDVFFEEWLCNALQCSRKRITSMTIAECVDKLVQQRIQYPADEDFWRHVSVPFKSQFAEELASWRDAGRI